MKGLLSYKNQGFTLIELMILVSLIGIALSVGLPSFKTFFERQRINGVADNLYFMMKLARSEAAKQGTNVFIVARKTTSAKWCVGVSDANDDCDCGTANSCTIDAAERVLASDDYPNVLLDSFADGSKTLLSIDAFRGRALTKTFKFSINTGADKKDIDIVRSSMGRERICSPSGTSNRYPKC